MFDAVPIDVPQPYGLARLGAPAGFVLTPDAPRSPALPYEIPRRGRGGRGWLKVRLRATVELGGDHGDRGLGAVVLYTDGRASASAEFKPVRRRGGRAVRWTEVALHHAEQHVTRAERFTVDLDNYARIQGSGPGRHRLSFGLRLDDGMRVERVTVHPSSGLVLSRQPPQALAISSVVRPRTPRAGAPFTLRYTVRNIGIVASGRVTLPALLPPSVSPAGPSPRIASVPAGGERTAELRLRASRGGDFTIQTLARSRVGQALDEVDVHVTEAQSPDVAAAAPSTGAEIGGGADDDGTASGLPIALAAIVGAGATAAALLLVNRRRART